MKKISIRTSNTNKHLPCFVISLGDYDDEFIHITIGLIFCKLEVILPITIKNINYCDPDKYGFVFVNIEGAEHCLFLYFKNKCKIIDMPWKLEHYRTTYFDKEMKQYSYYSLSKRQRKKWFENNSLPVRDYLLSFIDSNDNFYYDFDYTYNSTSGKKQKRTAKVIVEEREWRRKWLMFSKWKNYVKRELDIKFNEGTGEEVDSWKGGVFEISYPYIEGMSIEEMFRKFEKEEKI